MAKAADIASALRKLADSLDTIPEQELPTPRIHFCCTYQNDPKTPFKALASVMPHPLKKEYDEAEHGDLNLRFSSDAMYINAYVSRAKVCRLVEPAKPARYECDPLLSADDEAELDALYQQPDATQAAEGGAV